MSRLNIVVIGMLAALYGNLSPTSPVRGWGHENQYRSITWRKHTYSANQHRVNGVTGLRLTVRDEDGDKKVVFDGWTPWTSFDELTSILEIEWTAI